MLSLSQINIRDPFVLLAQDTYYLYGTRGETCWGPASGFDVYVSRDLETWSEPQACFENDGTFWADRNYWAPEVHCWKDHYYMFASFKNETRRRGTAILRADSPVGPFMPWSDGPVTPPEWECLDGTFFADDAGNPWMVFCHEWVQAGDGEVWAASLRTAPIFGGTGWGGSYACGRPSPTAAIPRAWLYPITAGSTAIFPS